jgi:hypothetical protein
MKAIAWYNVGCRAYSRSDGCTRRPAAVGDRAPLVALLLVMDTRYRAYAQVVLCTGATDCGAGNPAELAPALIFAAVYAAVLFGLRRSKITFGTEALLRGRLCLGLVDVDCHTLSTAQLAAQGGWNRVRSRRVTVAALSNITLKACWCRQWARADVRASCCRIPPLAPRKRHGSVLLLVLVAAASSWLAPPTLPPLQLVAARGGPGKYGCAASEPRRRQRPQAYAPRVRIDFVLVISAYQSAPAAQRARDWPRIDERVVATYAEQKGAR